ncbi:hypothetical protein SAMN06295974_3795 [Plantibacter flavus]|uniref:Uncharacterized protein n=1 Tax=Plantibacter flavus TaxID=150123 RepID=A0A3N2BLA2_9MICO|nr:DUF6283 family protein [Plantibacter flavus]ROR76057.1 hypothetical protein EDD42_4010 [Plantibacter flavus]SMG48954.1 hypothetical protein SAMN06295974_3795 [Plantibacter flavus]
MITVADGALPRKTPCASCPWRREVSSGIWDRTEYEKLPRYDGDIADQEAAAVFLCHQPIGEQHVCSGWLGHRDPQDLLAARLGVLSGELDVSAMEYTTDVPLFASGAEAAAHGLVDEGSPGTSARAVIDKILRLRGDVPE